MLLTAEATGDLIWNEIADKITSISKPKEKPEEIYIPPEKRQQIFDDLKLFWIIIIVIKLNVFYFHSHSHLIKINSCFNFNHNHNNNCFNHNNTSII